MVVCCNTRILTGQLTGVQRYTRELLSRFGTLVEPISPMRPAHGVQGHVWEQVVLPVRVGKRLLWSPSNTGPLTINKQVVTIMDLSPLDHPEWMNSRFTAWYRFLLPRLIKRVRRVLTISEFSKERIAEVCPESEAKVHVIPLAADTRFSPAEEEVIRSAIERLAIPSRHYLVALGSLEPRKNLHRLLQAWVAIQGKIPDDVWLVLAGAKGKRMVFEDVSFEHLPPRVHLTGHVPDDLLPALYSGAIAAPYLSLYEGFGLPPLEAMACGAPVLTSSTASLPEVVGDAAVMVDPYDVEEIGATMVDLVEDTQLRLDLRRKGLERASQFSWEKTADETWKVLKEAGRS